MTALLIIRISNLLNNKRNYSNVDKSDIFTPVLIITHKEIHTQAVTYIYIHTKTDTHTHANRHRQTDTHIYIYKLKNIGVSHLFNKNEKTF